MLIGEYCCNGKHAALNLSGPDFTILDFQVDADALARPYHMLVMGQVKPDRGENQHNHADCADESKDLMQLSKSIF